LTSSNSSTDLSDFGFGGTAPPSDIKKPSTRKPRKRPEDDEQINVPEEDIAEPGRAWYFVHTYSGHEFKVRDSILLQIKQVADANDKVFHVIVPTEEEIEIHNSLAEDPIIKYMSHDELEAAIKRVEKQMKREAKKENFIEASYLRDELFNLKKMLLEI